MGKDSEAAIQGTGKEIPVGPHSSPTSLRTDSLRRHWEDLAFFGFNLNLPAIFLHFLSFLSLSGLLVDFIPFCLLLLFSVFC